ncbi:hypothetical protein AB0N38_33175 [Micromonospora aurantiaca]|uniref:hypothetical protein n=1 Tax=Micromonospora aurantiaca (nom. illeg.) TaxID=47850 RepID=UPI003435A8F8
MRAYGWLLLLTEPGREPRPAPPLLTDEQRHVAAVRAEAEAADRAANLRAGLSAGPAGAVPVRLEMLTAQAAAVRAVAALAARVAVAAPVMPFGVPVTAGTVVHAVDWLAGDGGPSCWAAPAASPPYRRGVLVDVADLRLVDQVARGLQAAADRARAAAGIVDEAIAPYPNQPCPACGRRSLQIDATLPQERYWTVRCLSAGCRCAGPGCPCLQRPALEGRPHAWTYAELPRLELAQHRRRISHPVRSGAVGHGRWASRRRGER